MELKIEHLSKQFKDKTAVNDVSLTLTPGVWGEGTEKVDSTAYV